MSAPTDLPDGPDPDAIVRSITEHFDRVDVVTASGGWFFSCDAEKHWPNFATLVTSDEYDQTSDLDREGVFRLNMGVGRATFDRIGAAADPDITVFDRLFPHPVYGAQRWVSIVNPSAATFRDVVHPLLEEAYEIVAGRAARLAKAGEAARRPG